MTNTMKYTEFHRLIERNSWKFSHAEGSHYFYIKNDVLSPPIPYHGAKEIGEINQTDGVNINPTSKSINVWKH